MEDVGFTLWCGNLSDFVTEELLFELFNQAGPLQRVTIPQRDGRQQPFAFVTFKHECSVTYALSLFNKTELFGKLLNLRSRDVTNEVQEARSYNHSHDVGYRRNGWNERVNARRLDFSEDTSSLRGADRGHNNKNTVDEMKLIPGMIPQPGVLDYVQPPTFDINTLLQLGQQMLMPQCPPLPGLFGQAPLMMYPSQLVNQLYGGALAEQPNTDLNEQLEVKRGQKQAQSRRYDTEQGTYSGQNRMSDQDYDRGYDYSRSYAEFHNHGRRRSPIPDEYISRHHGSYREGPNRRHSPIHDEYNSRNRGGYRDRSHTPIHDEYYGHNRGELRHRINYLNRENHQNRFQRQDEHVRSRDRRNEQHHSNQSNRDYQNTGRLYNHSRSRNSRRN